MLKIVEVHVYCPGEPQKGPAILQSCSHLLKHVGLYFSRSVVALDKLRKTVDGIELLLESERI